MTENLPHPNMEITEYDKEIYKLEKRIGEYQIKLNATNFDLGSVSIETTYKGDYQIKILNKLENKKIYLLSMLLNMVHNIQHYKHELLDI